MSLLQALILGIVQGITEFFPVSSSAHLRLFKKLMDIPDGEHLLYFDLICHAGTLLALIIYLRKEILPAFRQFWLYFIALIPLIPAYFFLKPVRVALSNPSYLGFFLLVTALLLFIASRVQKTSPIRDCNEITATPLEGKTRLSIENSFLQRDIKLSAAKKFSKSKRFFSSIGAAFISLQSLKPIHALYIGIAQSFALIPGISRSGSTIAIARLCGWKLIDCAKFSFLLAIPTILGGELLETIKLMKDPSSSIPLANYAIGFISAFGSGLFSCRAVFWIYERNWIRPFAWYCLTVGLIALIWLTRN